MTKFLVYAYMFFNHLGLLILFLALDFGLRLLLSFLIPEERKS